MAIPNKALTNLSPEQFDQYINLPTEEKIFFDIQANSDMILDQASKEGQAAIEAAIATGREDVIQSVKQGVAAAVQSTADGVREAWKAANIGFDKIDQYFQEGVAKLEPFRKTGVFATDEIASMLRIRGSSGELKPFDLDTLRKTPGYLFEQDEGLAAISRAYQGNYQGGARDVMRFAEGLAEGYFSRRVEQLRGLGEIGLSAAQTQGQLASAAGGQSANLAGQLTSTIGGLHQAQTGAFGTLYAQQAQSLGSLAGTTAELQVGLISDISKARLDTFNAVKAAELQNYYRKWEQDNSGGFLSGLLKTGVSAAVGAVGYNIGGPIGAAIGKTVTDRVLGGNKNKGYESKYGLDLGLGAGYGRA